MYKKYIKRLLDIVCSFLAIIVLAIPLLIIALLVRIELGSPIIYSQKRPGKIDPNTGKEKVFLLYKFRSMTNEKDADGKLLPDSVRLTKFGRTIRSLSLDELPSLWNILKGDISIVGPRPLAVSYLPYYTAEERHRHDVRPGLTGWAQVNGRNSISWDEKFKYDVEYVKNISFIFDIKILIKTVKKVFIREGIGQGEQHPENLYDVRADWLDEDQKIKAEYQNNDLSLKWNS